MNLEKLLKDRMIKRIRIDKNLAKMTFYRAEKDIKTAKEIFKTESYGWCLAIAYNSMLQCSRALMFLRGFKPAGQYQHITTIKFVHEVFGKDVTDRMVNIFDRLRKKRHRVIYEQPDIISEEEASNAIGWAEEFMSKVKEILKKEKII